MKKLKIISKEGCVCETVSSVRLCCTDQRECVCLCVSLPSGIVALRQRT